MSEEALLWLLLGFAGLQGVGLAVFWFEPRWRKRDEDD